MADLKHTMKSVSQRTGLSPHVIRVWEKRYGAVEPARTTTNRRLYSESEVERLAMLHAVTRAGHSIGTIARLPNEQLRVLAGQQPFIPATPSAKTSPTGLAAAALPHLNRCVEAIQRMDTRALDNQLQRASLELGGQGLLQKLIAPLAQRLGDLWLAGEVTAAQEHFASNVIRVFLGGLARPYAVPENAPNVVVTTPAGQHHELGAVLVAAAARGHGWSVTYLGASLPAVEIASSAIKSGARAVALSVVYPADDPLLPAELESLRRFLPSSVRVLAGGRAVEHYRPVLDKIGALTAGTLADLYQLLDGIRGKPLPSPPSSN